METTGGMERIRIGRSMPTRARSAISAACLAEEADVLAASRSFVDRNICTVENTSLDEHPGGSYP